MPIPTVSVIITTYYRNSQLKQALESINNLSYPEIEVIVVDDSGEGHAREVLRQFNGVEYLKLEENIGPHRARDAGVEYATGDFIQFLDDDDRLLEGKITKQIEVFENRDIGVVYCGIISDRENGRPILPEHRGNVLREALMFQLGPCITGSMLIQREQLEKIRPLTNQYGGADDTGMKINLAKITEFDFVDEPLVYYNSSEDSYGATWSVIEGQTDIIKDNKDLYNDFSPDVLRTAIANRYLSEGNYHLNQSIWSVKAIQAYYKAFSERPGFNIQFFGSFLASLLGRPGRRFAKSFYLDVISNSEWRGNF